MKQLFLLTIILIFISLSSCKKTYLADENITYVGKVHYQIPAYKSPDYVFNLEDEFSVGTSKNGYLSTFTYKKDSISLTIYLSYDKNTKEILGYMEDRNYMENTFDISGKKIGDDFTFAIYGGFMPTKQVGTIYLAPKK